MSTFTASPGVKMQFLIARRDGVSRDELVANWFANHMPGVIGAQESAAASGRPHATRYIATLFEPVPSGAQVWDGVAQLWFDSALPRMSEAHGTQPRDTFQQKAAPYSGWPTTEYVVLDGALPLTPNTLNDPFPFTRDVGVKVTSLITARTGVGADELFGHWLDVHAPNVRSVMEEVGGLRYVVSLSTEPDVDDYAGMAELYFPSADTLREYGERFEDDGMGALVDVDALLRFSSTTEMVGIP